MLTFSIFHFLETHYYSPLMNEILKLSKESTNPLYDLNKILSENCLTKLDIKQEALNVILDLVEMIIEDDVINEDEIKSIRLLRVFLGIEEGDFNLYEKMDRVEHIILNQMEKLYADNRIDATEALYKSNLQGLFGLGYNEYQEIVDKVALVAYARGAEMKDLDTFLDYGLEL